MDYRMVTWPMTSRDPHRRCEAVRSAIVATGMSQRPLTMHLHHARSFFTKQKRTSSKMQISLDTNISTRKAVVEL